MGRSGDPLPDATQYDVFSSAGELLGELTVPQGFSIVEVGEDYLLGQRRTADDVPVVELYRLDRGGFQTAAEPAVDDRLDS